MHTHSLSPRATWRESGSHSSSTGSLGARLADSARPGPALGIRRLSGTPVTLGRRAHCPRRWGNEGRRGRAALLRSLGGLLVELKLRPDRLVLWTHAFNHSAIPRSLTSWGGRLQAVPPPGGSEPSSRLGLSLSPGSAHLLSGLKQVTESSLSLSFPICLRWER